MRVTELRYTPKSRPRPEQITNSCLFIPSPYTAVITDCYQKLIDSNSYKFVH